MLPTPQILPMYLMSRTQPILPTPPIRRTLPTPPRPVTQPTPPQVVPTHLPSIRIPDPCTYDDLSDGISNAGFEIGCGEDGNRLDGWNTTSTDAEVFIATTGERFITAPDIDDGEARFSAFNGNHAARLSNRNNGERTEGGIYQERSLSNIQAPALLMGAMVRYSPFDPIDEYARALKFG